MEFLEKETKAYKNAQRRFANKIKNSFTELVSQTKIPIKLIYANDGERMKCALTNGLGCNLAPDTILPNGDLDFKFGFTRYGLSSYTIKLESCSYILKNIDALSALYDKASKILDNAAAVQNISLTLPKYKIGDKIIFKTGNFTEKGTIINIFFESSLADTADVMWKFLIERTNDKKMFEFPKDCSIIDLDK